MYSMFDNCTWFIFAPDLWYVRRFLLNLTCQYIRNKMAQRASMTGLNWPEGPVQHDYMSPTIFLLTFLSNIEHICAVFFQKNRSRFKTQNPQPNRPEPQLPKPNRTARTSDFQTEPPGTVIFRTAEQPWGGGVYSIRWYPHVRSRCL